MGSFPCLMATTESSGPAPALRIFVVLMLGVCIAIMYGMRADLSVGVERMQPTWEEGWTGPVLSSFFVGYIVGNIPSSRLAKRHGARAVLAAGVLVASAANAVLPFVAATPGLVMALRVLCGLAQACTFPCAYQLLYAWTTPDTRSRAVTSSMSLGTAAGTASGFFVSQQLLVRYDLVGCFGVWTVLSALWALVWLLLVPAQCPDHLHGHASHAPSGACGKEPEVGFAQLALQPTLLVLYACHVAANFINYGLLTQLPLFLSSSLHASPAVLAAGTTLPYLANVVLANLAATVADSLITSGRMSRTRVRKVSTAIGIGGSGVLLYAAGCAEDASSAVGFVIAANGALGLAQPGWQSLYLDAFGELSGTAYSYSNTLATLAGIAAPVIASTFVRRLGETAGYRATFLVFGPLFGLPAVAVFCWVASAMRVTSLVRGASAAGGLECARDDALSLSSLMSRGDESMSSPPSPDDPQDTDENFKPRNRV